MHHRPAELADRRREWPGSGRNGAWRRAERADRRLVV